MLDPRPHLGEPLALDLLNTRWMSGDGPQDLLTDIAGLEIWLAANGLAGRCDADAAALEAVRAARAAIYDAVRDGRRDALNDVLNHGRIRRSLADAGPVDTPEITDPAWLPGWLAADNLLSLLATAPGRIRQCAHPDCVLFFYDTSKNGTRRWHSMATCGNRTKAARHYAKKS
ncbi:CGNR zinc finger domain-containing protein [Nocardia cyriacigeorgica]|uniref:CGNR zinc finger domain-containing protein n=1 Tax=Nocardia cyriacigeorgica TaxID=135487 RepID=UPI0013D2D8CC|nr:CGNR zinc finger domain-containing protein [Nocardia cyriacigeorgica]MBF6436003.1 CGNR zinc finger domain-containing protein [Nocardia cyriacigeorgica]MBF6453921.1 CGNR zinc finger domain-containing protein [Nocardia cyriacigeorgica]MBF6481288.1 CGNR zinc finger domain-containing protein [Nocardia cyriacigeorgica]MBF6551815.1 CGNR zinc finger domain-containing protein [Nocardia cyriacigeorgica]NEW26544.1 CGNR zinc finger domain-containing protein [Nocardia cyriacigeorgica]